LTSIEIYNENIDFDDLPGEANESLMVFHVNILTACKSGT